MYYRERDKDGTPTPIADPEAEWQRKEVVEEFSTADQRAQARAKFMTMAAAFGMNLRQAQAKWDEAEARQHASD